MAYNYKREDQAYGYDKDTDYSQKMSEAAAAGDYAAAARYEQQRNEKIKGEGLTQYQPTNQYAQYLPKQQTRSSDDILDRILNREDFSYDLDGDALYQQYKDQYLQQGKLAMQDTMGQAAALTGGYGNSYAQTVGQQAYNQYLGQLNAVVPELYSLARSRYTQEGNDLWNLYNAYADREAQDYSREIDARNFDYQRSQNSQNSAYNLAMTMLQSGILPSDALLSNAGISSADARAIYEKINPTSDGSNEVKKDPPPDVPITNFSQLSPNAQQLLSKYARGYNYDYTGYKKDGVLYPSDAVVDLVRAFDNGTITAQEQEYIARKLGIDLDADYYMDNAFPNG
ncbi:MAG: hypothetical protein ACI3VU_02040 [Faecousia sp.]|nr:hypothetical protein [Bacillota bacterium]